MAVPRRGQQGRRTTNGLSTPLRKFGYVFWDENNRMDRQPEPEAMDIPREAEAYALADFAEVNEAFVARLHELAGTRGNLLAADLGTGPGGIPLRLLRVRPVGRPRRQGLDAAHVRGTLFLHRLAANRRVAGLPCTGACCGLARACLWKEWGDRYDR